MLYQTTQTTNKMTKQEIQINIQRLEKTISMITTFQTSYINNCKIELVEYKKMLTQANKLNY